MADKDSPCASVSDLVDIESSVSSIRIPMYAGSVIYPLVKVNPAVDPGELIVGSDNAKAARNCLAETSVLEINHSVENCSMIAVASCGFLAEGGA